MIKGSSGRKPLKGAAHGVVFVLGFANGAHAATDRDVAMYVEPGISLHRGGASQALTIGVQFPRKKWALENGGPWSSSWNLQASEWRAPIVNGRRRNFTQLGALASVRYRFREGQSPIFVEAGVGGTVLSGIYRWKGHEFSTAFQFIEEVGVGYTPGRNGKNEYALMVEHFSNAGLKSPNPGESFVFLRYTRQF